MRIGANYLKSLSGLLAVAVFSLMMSACGVPGFADSVPALPGVPGLPGSDDELSRQSEACSEAMREAVSDQGLTDPDQINSLIGVIQSQNHGCGAPIWNPLATGDPGADECLRGILRDQVAAGAVGVPGDGTVFIGMQASDGTPTGEGCFMYHAKRGTWVASGLDHARWYMRENRCRRAPGAMIEEPDPDCVP